MSPRRTQGALALVLLATAGAAVAPSGAAATHQDRGCSTLRGQDLLPGGAIKVVDRTYRRPGGGIGHRYLACALEDNPIVALPASRPGGRLQLLSSDGPTLAVRDVATGAVRVRDVVERTQVRLRRAGRDPVGRVVVADSGEAAALFPTPGGRELVGFDVDGTAYRLGAGRIPAASLRRTGDYDVRWTEDGRARRANLSTPAIPCAKLAGREVARSAEARVVQVRYAAEYFEGNVSDEVTRYRGCALDGRSVRVLGQDSAAPIQGGSAYEVLGLAGTTVLERRQFVDSGLTVSIEELSTTNLATGRRTALWGNADAEGPNQELGSELGPAFVAPGGQVGVLFPSTDSTSKTSRVIGFSATGTPRELEAGDVDPKSLRLEGTVLRWVTAGQPRAFDLATL